MNEQDLFMDIRDYCIANADIDIENKYSRYFKEGFNAYGLTTEILHSKVDSILSNYDVDMSLVLKTSRLLLKTGKYEETSFAIRLLKHFKKEFSKNTFKEIGKWFEIGIINWAHTDVICGEIIPAFFKQNLITIEDLSDWRIAENKFQRRAVPVSMLCLLKSTEDYARLFEFIDPIMMDPERVVHQGLGWFLRETWKIRGDVTETFLIKWKNDAPRLIFQYATERMTKEYRKKFRKDKKKKTL